MAEEEIILKVSLDGSKESLNSLNLLQEEITALAQEKKKLTAQEKQLQKEIEESGEATDEQTASLKDLAEQQVQNNLVLKQTKQEFNETEKSVLLSAKTNRLAAGSVAQLAAQHAKDKDALRLLSKEERKNTEEGRALNKKVKDQSDELKELEKSYGVTSRSVGDYGKATESVLPLMGGFGAQIQGIIGNLGQIKTAIGKFTTAQKGMTASTSGASKGLKAFRVALISTGIGAIVVLLGTLVAAFLSTQRGIDAVNKVLRPLQEIMSTLLGVVQDLATKGFDRLKKAIDDPKQAFEDFGNFIKDQFITRVLAIPKAFFAIQKAVVGSIKLLGVQIKKAVADVPLLGRLVDKSSLEKDLEEAKKATLSAFGELADAQIELAIGVDADKVKETVKDLAGTIGEAADRGAEIDILTKQIERVGVSLERQKKTANRLFNEQKLIAENTKLSAQEQLAAAAKAQEILKGVTKLEVDQQNRQIRLAKLKAEANDTDIEAQTDIQNLIADREQIEADAIQKGLELRNKANSIAKAAEDKRKKAIADEAKAEKKAIEDKSKAEVKAIDKKIELLKLERQLELATIDETNEEKIQKEADLLDTIGKLRVEKAKLNGEDVAAVELENQIAKAEQAKEQQDIIDEQLKEKEAEKEAFKQQVRSETEDLAVQGGKALIAAAGERAQREKDIELANLDAKLQQGLITQEDFEKKRLQIEQTAFKKKKARDLAVVAIDLAKELSSISAAAAANPANALTFGAAGVSQAAVLSGLAVARSAVQAGIIASQKFAAGGIIHGASHANGGVAVRVGGSGMIEAEGGEAIINKRSTKKHLGLLSAINQDGGGISLASPNTGTLSKFGNGGIATSGAAQSQTIDLNDLENRIASAVGSITVQNVASETTGVANRVKQIEDSASF